MGDFREEYLDTYSDIIEWALLMGVLSAKEAQELIRKAKREPSKAEDVRKHAIELREAICHVFSDISKRKRLAKKDVSVINRDLSRTMAQSLLLHTKDGFIRSTSGGKGELDFMLGPIVRSAAKLLTSESLERVKECVDDRGCGYLFLDKSRKRSRR